MALFSSRKTIIRRFRHPRHRRRLRRLRGRLRIPLLGARPEDRPGREGQHRAERRGCARPVGDQLLHGHAVGREPAGRPRALRARRPDGAGAGRPGLRHRPARRLDRAQVRGMGPADHEGSQDRPLPARRKMADHDPRRELQADHRRGRREVCDRGVQPHHGDPPADGQGASRTGSPARSASACATAISTCSGRRR